jgi:hypothetical protein
MTPEERQQKLDFIVTNYAEFSAGLERHDESIKGLQRLSRQFLSIIRAEREVQKADHEAQSRALEAEYRLREAEIEAERQARKAQLDVERLAREADYRKHRERIDSIDEMTKILREMLEGKLRPPDNPPEEKK